MCFNSMSSSFQSECVFCDYRLYASTMTACTGQPMLANNVTQAQAFCIATACLQVQVSPNSNDSKANPSGGHNSGNSIVVDVIQSGEDYANNMVYHVQNVTVHSANQNKRRFKRFVRARAFATSDMNQQRPSETVAMVQEGDSRMHQLLSASTTQHKLELVESKDSHNLHNTGLSPPHHSSIAATIFKPVEAAANVDESAPMGVESTSGVNSTGSSIASFPDFNQMHAQIGGPFAGPHAHTPVHYRPAHHLHHHPQAQVPGGYGAEAELYGVHHAPKWRPSLLNRLMVAQQRQMHYLHGRVGQLMHTVSNNLSLKQAQLNNMWHRWQSRVAHSRERQREWFAPMRNVVLPDNMHKPSLHGELHRHGFASHNLPAVFQTHEQEDGSYADSLLLP